MSLIRPMMAIYLVEYEGRMKPCLEAEPLRFKITTTSETVYRNGYGSYLYSVPHPDQVSYFNVNRRFGPAFEKVGTMEPDSIVRRMLEQSFQRKTVWGERPDRQHPVDDGAADPSGLPVATHSADGNQPIKLGHSTLADAPIFYAQFTRLT